MRREFFALRCQRAAAHHFSKGLCRKRRLRRKAKSRLTLDAYMIVSATGVNPDWQEYGRVRVDVGQISQELGAGAIATWAVGYGRYPLRSSGRSFFR